MNKVSKESFIVEPTREIIDDYIRRFDEDSEIRADVDAVKKVFQTFDNSSLENILIKTIILNNRYSAGLCDRPSDKKGIAIDVYSMSVLLKKEYHDPTSVDQFLAGMDILCSISEARGKNKPISFLSKYYHWSCAVKDNPVDLPMYDKYARGMLYYLCKKCSYLESFTQEEILDYTSFFNMYLAVLGQINNHLGTDYSVSDFDKYLWKYAKELRNPEDPEAVSVDIGI